LAAVAAAQNKNGFEVWPDNWPVFILFCQLQTQWTAGPNGVVGLNYLVLFHKLDRMNLSPSEYEEWEEDIRVLEHSALNTMQENKE
jgi:hypothetical protein